MVGGAQFQSTVDTNMSSLSVLRYQEVELEVELILLLCPRLHGLGNCFELPYHGGDVML